ncbi:MAG TPA: hypothetical protein VMW36_10815 [Patescibacteria group bacterium]|nr:hypothetical protein [Patescibacteria group bacterium]
MARVYCDLDDAKRLLRSSILRESRVRFSDAFKENKADAANVGTIALSGVSFLSSFAGHENFTFSFTDSTSFEVSGDVVGDLGTGTTDAAYSCDHFTIAQANWSGVADDGDKWYIMANSDVSDDDGDSYIVDVTRLINARLEQRYGDLSRAPFYADPSVAIPDSIKYACSRLAAYEIFNSAFAGSSTDEESPVDRWKTEAEDILEKYLESHGVGPMWKSRETLVTKLGVPGVGDGEIETDNLTDSQNKKYQR